MHEESGFDAAAVDLEADDQMSGVGSDLEPENVVLPQELRRLPSSTLSERGSQP